MPKLKYEIERAKEQKTLEDIEEQELSTFQGAQKLNYNQDQIVQLKKEVFAEFEAIKKERDEIQLDNFFDKADNQYKGIMPRRAGNQFNLDTGLTKVKENDIVRDVMASHWGVDPIVSIKPRPEFGRQGGYEVCQLQEEFIDYAFDMRLPYRSVFRRATHSAVRKKVGWIKWMHKVRTETRRREETYKPETEQRIDPNTRQPIMVNKGVENFIRTHRQEVEKNPEKYQWIINRLNEGTPVTLDVEYPEVVYNDPFPKFVNNKNFYARLATDGYEGLKETRLTVERVNYTYYKLKQFEKEYDFVNVDKLLYDNEEDEKNRKVREGAYNENYNILECVYRFKENNEVDEEEKRIVCFFSEEKQIYIGGVYYPLIVLECYYVPRYAVLTDEPGLYQGCVSEDIRDNHIADNAILNFTLEGAWIANMVTPITPEDSAVDLQFANKRWMHGLPLNARKGDLDFLSNYMKPMDISGLLALKFEVVKNADDLTGVSGLRTGRESPLDPTAPGNKTLALLQESGKNVLDYVTEISKGFAIDANCVLRLYYEISQNDILFINRRATIVTGQDPFKSISKADLIAKTTIQPMAHAFDFDKLRAKKEDVALYQLTRQEPLIARNPQAVWTLLRNIYKNWSQKWRNQIDQILPSLEQLKQQQLQVATQAVSQFVQTAMRNAQLTKQQPEFNPEQLVKLISDLQAEMVTNPPEEVLKARAKQAQGAK